jgi:hypothetical protein
MKFKVINYTKLCLFRETPKFFWLNVVNYSFFSIFAGSKTDFMLLIADSGSSKTDWILTDGATEMSFATDGLNPYFVGSDSVCTAIASHPALAFAMPDSVFFYGAGCSPAKIHIIEQALKSSFPTAEIHVASDMLAAARALFDHSKGIACILGTGANSCCFDGSGITAQIPPLGYVLGDEGSGADLGKRLLRLVLRRRLPRNLLTDFNNSCGLSAEQILPAIYSNPCPNRFLAGFSPFIASKIEYPEIQQLVEDAFTDFVQNMLLPYECCRQLPVGFVGSVAFVFQNILRNVLETNGLQIGAFLRTPLQTLAKFHLKQ